MMTFESRGLRVSYREYGSGPRAIVLTHGLLMDGRMFEKLAPALAARGNRVLLLDLPGHGASDAPHEMGVYSMTFFARDVVALLDHLGLKSAVIGGTSLGANVALEVACEYPDRVRALVLEMPVLEKGITAAAALFVPLAIALRLNPRVMRFVSSVTRRIPRSLFLVDLMLDFARRDPGASLAVLDGLTFGRIAPPREERTQIPHPTLVIGHPSDPIHAFSDADDTARELPKARLVSANSIVEWRIRPQRLDNELCGFLDEVWAEPLQRAG